MNSTSSRSAGVLIPAFSPRRNGDLGIGDTLSMKQWIDWAAEYSVGFLQLLPINETGSDDSPYNAISSVALEPLYLTMTVDEIPGLLEADITAARAELGEENLQTSQVAYSKVRAVKLGLLRTAYSRWNSDASFAEKKNEFTQFCREEAAWLNDYSMFRWCMEQDGGRETWDLWSEKYNQPAKAREYFSAQREKNPEQTIRELTFFSWVQWLCFRQWRAVRKHADYKKVKLMGDIPIGISYYSADVFFQPENFDLTWCGGAPPETMFKHDRFIQRWGQNWGIPLYKWDKMEKEGFPWWQQRIGKLTEIFNIFRIDHILGFYRIYAFPWRPQRNAEFLDISDHDAFVKAGDRFPQWAWRPDDTDENKHANRDDGDRRLKAIIAAAHGGEVVGEDLGCVPDYVRPHLASLDIAGFRIPHWDSLDGHVVSKEELPECSFATYATHDHDTIAAMWDGFHQAASSHDEGCEDGRWNIRMMAEFAGIECEMTEIPAYNHEVQWKLLDALLQSKSRYAALMITDLFAMKDRYNMPGTVGSHNWSFRLPFTLQEIHDDATLRGEAVHLRKSILKASRNI